MLRSSMSLDHRTELDVAVRRVGSLPSVGTAAAVPAYTALDLRYAWQATQSLQLAFVVQHALEPYHLERGESGLAAEIARFVGLKALGRF